MNTDLGSMIICTPGVVGGRPRIDGTRVPVSAIAICYKQGFMPEEIVQQFERLSIAQIYAALAYYHINQVAIDTEIEQEQELYEKLANEQEADRKKA